MVCPEAGMAPVPSLRILLRKLKHTKSQLNAHPITSPPPIAIHPQQSNVLVLQARLGRLEAVALGAVFKATRV